MGTTDASLFLVCWWDKELAMEKREEWKPCLTLLSPLLSLETVLLINAFPVFQVLKLMAKSCPGGAYSCDGIWVALGSLGRCSWALSAGAQMKTKYGISLCV